MRYQVKVPHLKRKIFVDVDLPNERMTVSFEGENLSLGDAVFRARSELLDFIRATRDFRDRRNGRIGVPLEHKGRGFLFPYQSIVEQLGQGWLLVMSRDEVCPANCGRIRAITHAISVAIVKIGEARQSVGIGGCLRKRQTECAPFLTVENPELGFLVRVNASS